MASYDVLIVSSCSIKKSKTIKRAIKKGFENFNINLDDVRYIITFDENFGGNRFVKKWIVKNGVSEMCQKTNFGKHKSNANIIRNKKALKKCDYVIVIWDKVDYALYRLIKKARKMDIPIYLKKVTTKETIIVEKRRSERKLPMFEEDI